MLAMQEAPASGAPPWVALTVTVTTACSEIGLTGEALATSSNAPPLGAAAGGAAGAGAWGFGAAWAGAACATGAAGAMFVCAGAMLPRDCLAESGIIRLG